MALKLLTAYSWDMSFLKDAEIGSKKESISVMFKISTKVQLVISCATWTRNMYNKYRITVVVLMVVQSSRMQRTRTIAAAIKKYLLRTSLLHSRYLFFASICLVLSFFPSYFRYSYYSCLCALIDSFIRLLINWFIHLFILSFIHSYSHLFILSFIHSLSFYHTHTARTLSLYRKSPFSSHFTTPYICHLSTYLHLVITIIIIIIIVSLYIFGRKSLLLSFLMAGQLSAATGTGYLYLISVHCVIFQCPFVHLS